MVESWWLIERKRSLVRGGGGCGGLEVLEIVADAEFERLWDIVALDKRLDLAGELALTGFATTTGNTRAALGIFDRAERWAAAVLALELGELWISVVVFEKYQISVGGLAPW